MPSPRADCAKARGPLSVWCCAGYNGYEMDIETIWTEYRTRLRAYLASRVGDPADVDDLLQDIMIRSHQSLPKLRSPAHLRSWLFQIAANAITDHYRRRRIPAGDDPDTLAASEDDLGARADLERCIKPFLAALPDETARLLWAVDVEGRTQKDVAAELGLSYSTLKSRVRSGRDQMRHLFEFCCRLTLDGRGNVTDYEAKSNACQNC